MNFWIGLAIGLFVGANFGLIISSLCVAAARGNAMREEEHKQVSQESKDGAARIEA